jgi:hypothetical protein
MPSYRIYNIDFNGHFWGVPKDIECADDAEAIQQAILAINGRDVELWQLDRFVARLPRYQKPE